MPFTPADSGSLFIFDLILVVVFAALVAAVRHAFRDRPRRAVPVIIGAVAYLTGLTVLIATGLLEHLPLRGLPVFFGLVLVVSVTTGLSPVGARLAAAIPTTALVLFQAFRLPLELVLHAWAGQGTIPNTMTWTGRNWDIVSGVVALGAAPFAERRVVAWTANLVGAALLVNVMRVALLSSPVPFGWDVTPPLLLALHLPYALIAPVCVGGALICHIVLTRRLLQRPSLRSTADSR